MGNMAVIVDSTCNLPSSVLQKYKISRVPLSYSVDGHLSLDPCSDDATLELFKSGKLDRKHEVTTRPPTPEDFSRCIIRRIKEGYKFIVVQTVNRVQGQTYNNANMGASLVKKKLGSNQDINIRVMDSRTVFSGQGLMVAETVRRMSNGRDPAAVRRELDDLSTKIHTFLIPKNPLVALERAKTRNENAVGWGQAFVANALGIHPILCVVNDSSYLATKVFNFKNAAKQLFKHTVSRIEEGKLLTPFITINYGGSIHQLKALPGYDELNEAAEAHKCTIVPSVMSVAGGIYTSVGSISLAIATAPHKWQET